MSESRPLWRSLLFVPANSPRFIDKAHMRGADAIILDLEDSVPLAERAGARTQLAQSIALAGRGAADVLVRVNNSGGELEADLAACEANMPAALMIPKVESPRDIARISGWLSCRPQLGQVRYVVLIETALGLLNMRDIAQCDPRIVALSLGGEDFALDVGAKPSVETLELPMQLSLYTARAAGLLPLGSFGSIAEYADLDVVRVNAQRARDFGFEGAACIHPSVVPVFNEVFAPSIEEAQMAARIVAAYAQAQDSGRGAIEVDGKMVDVPVALRAQRVLDRQQQIMNKTRVENPTGKENRDE